VSCCHTKLEQFSALVDDRWYILKPGFADRAQGIRLFSSQQELQEIFEAFEPDSDDESVGPTNQVEAFREFKKEADKALELMRANGLKIEDSDSEGEAAQEEEEEEEEEDEGTGVMTSQLRHFVIQVSGLCPRRKSSS